MTLRWGSFISTPDGEIDYARIRSLVAVLLALAGGGILCGVMAGILKPASDVVMIGVGALVLPLTGGKVADAILTRKAEA